jgi:hypothetical protein
LYFSSHLHTSDYVKTVFSYFKSSCFSSCLPGLSWKLVHALLAIVVGGTSGIQVAMEERLYRSPTPHYLYSVAAGPLLLLAPLFLLFEPFSALSFQLKLLQSALYLSVFSLLPVAGLSAVAWLLLVVVLQPLVVEVEEC